MVVPRIIDRLAARLYRNTPAVMVVFALIAGLSIIVVRYVAGQPWLMTLIPVLVVVTVGVAPVVREIRRKDL